MAAGLAALLDDIAALAKLTAASLDDVAGATGRASAKAAGVVVDDTAVAPRFVEGVSPKRELPIIKKITIGSLRNKLLVILPVALLLSQFAPWLLTPLLMLGGTYLCFEGAEKVIERFSPNKHAEEELAADRGPDAEKKIVSGAVRTDLILSSEIMVISLNEVSHEPLLSRTLILVAVAIFITILVYGVVAVIVKMDDIGLALAKKDSEGAQKVRPRTGQGHACGAAGHLRGGRLRHAVGRRAHHPHGHERSRLHARLRLGAPPRRVRPPRGGRGSGARVDRGDVLRAGARGHLGLRDRGYRPCAAVREEAPR